MPALDGVLFPGVSVDDSFSPTVGKIRHMASRKARQHGLGHTVMKKIFDTTGSGSLICEAGV